MSKKYDSLSIRMKENYENCTRIYLPRRTYVLIRVDGRAFHTFTRGLKRPYDVAFSEDMTITAKALCAEMSGAAFAYVQSDEISLLLTDFDSIATEAFYGNNLQKLCSISSSVATAAFNEARLLRHKIDYSANTPTMPKFATFDSRVFTIPDRIEVANYTVWRYKDCTRNAISMTAQSQFSAKQLHGKSCQDMITMIGDKWETYPDEFKYGRFIVKDDKGKFNIEIKPNLIEDREWLMEKIPVPQYG